MSDIYSHVYVFHLERGCVVYSTVSTKGGTRIGVPTSVPQGPVLKTFPPELLDIFSTKVHTPGYRSRSLILDP